MPPLGLQFSGRQDAPISGDTDRITSPSRAPVWGETHRDTHTGEGVWGRAAGGLEACEVQRSLSLAGPQIFTAPRRSRLALPFSLLLWPRSPALVLRQAYLRLLRKENWSPTRTGETGRPARAPVKRC